MKLAITLFATALLSAAPALQAQDRSYTEGTVLEVTAVRVKDGQWDNYLGYLKDKYKPLLEAQKKAGIILGYEVYSTTPRSPADPNLYLTITYPNMAALDGLEDKVEPLTKEVIGEDRAQSNKAYADRGSMREILGTELVRELELK